MICSNRNGLRDFKDSLILVHRQHNIPIVGMSSINIKRQLFYQHYEFNFTEE